MERRSQNLLKLCTKFCTACGGNMSHMPSFHINNLWLSSKSPRNSWPQRLTISDIDLRVYQTLSELLVVWFLQCRSRPGTQPRILMFPCLWFREKWPSKIIFTKLQLVKPKCIGFSSSVCIWCKKIWRCFIDPWVRTTTYGGDWVRDFPVFLMCYPLGKCSISEWRN